MNNTVLRAEAQSANNTHINIQFSTFVSTLNEQDQTYNLAAYLIVQLGKNYNNGANERISGKELLGLAIRQIQQLQYLAGGMVIFLEAADEESLLSFYRANGFQQFDTRLTDSSRMEFM